MYINKCVINITVITMIKGKDKIIPDQAYYRPIGFQKAEAPRFLHNGHMKVVSLSALITGHLCSWYSFLSEAVSTTGPKCPSWGIDAATFRLLAQCLNQ